MRSALALGILLVATACSSIADDGSDTASSDLTSAEERRLFAEMAASYNDSWQFRALAHEGCLNVAGAALAVPPATAAAHLEAFWDTFHRRPAGLPMNMGQWGCDALAATIPYLVVGYADPLFKGAFPPRAPALPVASGTPISRTALQAFLTAHGLRAIRPDVLLYAFHLRSVSDANRARWMSLPECTRIDFGRRQAFRGLEDALDAQSIATGLDKRYATDRLRSVTTLSESPTWLPDSVTSLLRRCPQTAPIGAPVMDDLGEVDDLYFHQLATYAPGLGFRAVESFPAIAVRTDVPSPPIETWAEALNPRSSLGATVRVLSQLLTEAERGPVTVYGSIPYKRYGGDVDSSADYGPNLGTAYRFDASDVGAAMPAMFADDTANGGQNLRRAIALHPLEPAGRGAYLSLDAILSDDVVEPGIPANGLLMRPRVSMYGAGGAPIRPIASRRSVLARRYVVDPGSTSTTLAARYAALPPRTLAPAASVEAAVDAEGDLRLTPQTVDAWTTTKLFHDASTTILLKGNAMYRYDAATSRVRLAMPEGLSVCDWIGSPSKCFQVVGRRIFFAKSLGNIADDDGTSMGHAGVPGKLFTEHVTKQGLVLVYDLDADAWSRLPFSAAPATCQAGVYGLGATDSTPLTVVGDALTVRCVGASAPVDLDLKKRVAVTGPTLTSLPVKWVW